MTLAICCDLVVAPVEFVFTLAVGAGVDVAELVVAGALEPPELVWLVDGASAVLPTGVVSCVETDVTLDVAETVAILVVATAGEDTTLVGLSGLIGLTGDCTFVGFVTLFTHVFNVVVQTLAQIGRAHV